MKIVSIGPLPPIRGGISQAHHELCLRLAEGHSMEGVSFSQLYVKSLFRNQTASGGIRLSYPHSHSLEPLNPLSWYRTAKWIRKQNPDRVLFQWWTTYLAPCYLGISFFLGKKSRKGIIVHNLYPHPSNSLRGVVNFFHSFLFTWLHRLLSLRVLSSMDYIVAQSSEVEHEIRKLFPQKKTRFMLGPLVHFSPRLREKFSTKSKKASEKMLFFGFVRPYKGLDVLLHALSKVKNHPNLELIIAGEFWGGKSAYEKLIRDLGIRERVRVHDRFVSEGEMSSFFRHADVVIAPYRHISQSAVIPNAFYFGVPVITTRVGGNPDWVKDGENGFLVEPNNPDELARAIEQYFEKDLKKKFQHAILKSTPWAWTKNKEMAVLDLEEDLLEKSGTILKSSRGGHDKVKMMRKGLP